MAQIQTSNEGSKSHPRLPSPPPLMLSRLPPSGRKIQKVVSIGPYHHGKPELRLAEFVKPETLKMVVSENEDFYYKEIKKDTINIKNFYEKEPTDSFSDDELVRMMLLDACFIMIYIETSMPPLRPPDEMMHRQNALFMFQTLGMLTINQIPFWILKLVLSSRYDKDESQELLRRYFTWSLFGEFQPTRSSTPKNEEVLHLLEAFHRILVYGFAHEPKKTGLSGRFFCCTRAKEKNSPDPSINANRNTDLECGEPSQRISRFRSHSRLSSWLFAQLKMQPRGDRRTT
ncbi:hypothetical protein CDL12_10039 [Handroanthus impetiginosus]|uniref:Uncharacterized protein n=1 Tax=Handroanthus impetiginosus TaxID=429701 RepID=A0A2G9HIN5_9LAMI|nr:hypothetical protein CDL12_10039 [Handroanthus impetiginosus]